MITPIKNSAKQFLSFFTALLIMLALSACGGGTSSTSTATAAAVSPVATVQLLASSPQLKSDDTSPVIFTAVVKDSGNAALSGQTVSFSTSSGLIQVTSATTDATGKATASLTTGGDKTTRAIAVTATAGSTSATTTINVTGTTLSISGASSLVLGATTQLAIVLKDASSTGIAGQAITVTSAKGNTLSAASVTTNSSGQATINVTGAVSGTDTITATALGSSATFSLAVSSTNFSITSPADGTNVNLGATQTVTVHYANNGVNQANQTVNFTTTRGTVSAAQATTNASGNASVTVSSTTSGPGTLAASVAGGPSAQITLDFIATSPTKINLQASPTTIGSLETSALTAVVRDVNNNLVEGQTVAFSLTSDTSGGTLSPPSAQTDSSGSASATFTAGGGTTAQNGVIITATVVGTAVTTTATLTVAKKALFITLGTGNTVNTPSATIYQLPYAVFVNDAGGNAVAGATVTITLRPGQYRKGTMAFSGGFWSPSSPFVCSNEDINFNGILDSGEDFNGSLKLEPGNIATVPLSVTTDSTGSATFNVTYPRDHAYWVDVKLFGTATVSGSESTTSVSFTLPGAAADYNSSTTAPPGQTSPYGTAVCSSPL